MKLIMSRKFRRQKQDFLLTILLIISYSYTHKHIVILFIECRAMLLIVHIILRSLRNCDFFLAGSSGIQGKRGSFRPGRMSPWRCNIPTWELGEILIKNPLIMKEYWKDPEETAGQLKDGWLSTGDIAIRDEDDYFFIVDRKKDMIIAGGYNIYPCEIDEMLYVHPKIADAVAVGIADEYRG